MEPKWRTWIEWPLQEVELDEEHVDSTHASSLNARRRALRKRLKEASWVESGRS